MTGLEKIGNVDQTLMIIVFAEPFLFGSVQNSNSNIAE